MSTLLLDIFITGYILNEYIAIGYIYQWIYCKQVDFYWIYLSLDIFLMSTIGLLGYITIGYIYHWIYCQ